MGGAAAQPGLPALLARTAEQAVGQWAAVQPGLPVLLALAAERAVGQWAAAQPGLPVPLDRAVRQWAAAQPGLPAKLARAAARAAGQWAAAQPDLPILDCLQSLLRLLSGLCSKGWRHLHCLRWLRNLDCLHSLPSWGMLNRLWHGLLNNLTRLLRHLL